MPQNFLSHFNNVLAVPGDAGIEYTAGPNIEIEDHIISGRDWSTDIDSAIAGVKGSGFSAATAWVESQNYLTEHQDVSNLPYVQNSAIGVKGSLLSGISGSGFYAVSADKAHSAAGADYATFATNAESAEYAYSSYLSESATNAAHSDFTNFSDYSESAGFVVSGWDYTDSGRTAIKGYSGIPFANSDVSCPWISGSKVIGNVTADFGNSYQLISSFDFSGDKNHHISLKGSWITFPTTSHIASSLDNKFDTSSFNNFIDNGFNPNMNELHNATAYISAFVNTGCVHNSALDSAANGTISGISGSGFYAPSAGYIAEGWEYDEQSYITGYSGSAFKDSEGDVTPWISGAKDIGSEILNFGDTVQILSSFDLSGYRNHAIGVKGSVIALPTTGHIASALDEKLDASAFSDFVDNEYSTAKSQWINNDNYLSGKIDALSGHTDYISGQVDNKLDNSAFTSYTATAVQGIEYTGIAPIVVNNELHMISAQSAKLSVRNPLYFVEDSTSATTIGIYGSATMDSAAVTGTGQYALTTAGWTEVQGGSNGEILFETATPVDMYSGYVPLSGSKRVRNYDKLEFYFTNNPSNIRISIIDNIGSNKNGATATIELSHPVQGLVGTEWVCGYIGDYVGGHTGDGIVLNSFKRVLFGNWGSTATTMSGTTAEPNYMSDIPHSFYLYKVIGYIN